MCLGTRQFRRAEWIAASLEAKFLSIARKPDVTKDEIQTLLRTLLERILDDDQDARIHFREPGYPVHASRFDIEDSGGDLSKADEMAALADRDVWLGALAEGDYSAVSESVDELLDGREASPEDRRVLAHGVLEVFVKAADLAAGRSSGKAFSVFDVETGPSLPQFWRPTPQSAPLTKPVPLKPFASALIEPFFASRAKMKAVSARDMSKERTHLRRFMEISGDLPIDGYDRGHVTRWLDTLRLLPKLNGKSSKARAGAPSIQDLIRDAEEEGAQRLSEKTVENNLATLSAFFLFSVNQGHIQLSQRLDLVRYHEFRDDKAAKQQRDQWSSQELTKLFASPMWTGIKGYRRWAEPGPEIIRNAFFWIPLLALFHGARLEEFADLRREDLKFDSEAAIWAFDFNRDHRTLKTDNSVRVVPMHPELGRLGLLRAHPERN